MRPAVAIVRLALAIAILAAVVATHLDAASRGPINLFNIYGYFTIQSNLIVAGRYILQPEVMGILAHQGKGAGGEIQLTDAMASLIGEQPFHGVTFDGRRFDCGSKTGYIEANLALALDREDMSQHIRAFATKLLQE